MIDTATHYRTVVVVRRVPRPRARKVSPDAGVGEVTGQVRVPSIHAAVHNRNPERLLVQARPGGGGRRRLLLLRLRLRLLIGGAGVLPPDGRPGAVLDLVHADGDRVARRSPIGVGPAHDRVHVHVGDVGVVRQQAQVPESEGGRERVDPRQSREQRRRRR